jgi:hypothetical protein
VELSPLARKSSIHLFDPGRREAAGASPHHGRRQRWSATGISWRRRPALAAAALPMGNGRWDLADLRRFKRPDPSMTRRGLANAVKLLGATSRLRLCRMHGRAHRQTDAVYIHQEIARLESSGGDSAGRYRLSASMGSLELVHITWAASGVSPGRQGTSGDSSGDSIGRNHRLRERMRTSTGLGRDLVIRALYFVVSGRSRSRYVDPTGQMSRAAAAEVACCTAHKYCNTAAQTLPATSSGTRPTSAMTSRTWDCV